MKKTLIITLLFLGCQKNLKEQNVFFLTNNEAKYWRMIISDVPRDRGRGICFYKNGTFQGYDIDKKSRKRMLPAVHSDIGFVENEWDFPNDSIMFFGRDVPYKILFFTKDSFGITAVSFEKRVVFYKEKDQISTIDSTIPQLIYP